MKVWRVTIRPRAEADLKKAREWYEKARPGLGDEFLAEVRKAVRSLERNPESPPVYYRDFRRVFTDRFPYKLFYRIDGDRVIVFRILHAKQDHLRKLTSQ